MSQIHSPTAPMPDAPLGERRWQAVVARDARHDSDFVFAVRTTGIYCRPSCPARRPKRENVAFYATPDAAAAAGFRPCKRCKPDQRSLFDQRSAKVAEACRLIESAEELPSLDALADAIGMSSYHFHRVFKAALGVTPKAYGTAHRRKRVRAELGRSATVTEAIYNAGYNSNGRFYATSNQTLGMSPQAFRRGGTGHDIKFAVGECSLGALLVAASDKGVCAILFGDGPQDLRRELKSQFPHARLIEGDIDFEKVIAEVVRFVEHPHSKFDLPLDIRGTAFQHRVWEALRRIPVGSTASYTEIAERIGAPGSARAVARACASNLIAVAIPCHRVVRSDGSISGYRGGVARKRALLAKEAKS